MRLNEEEIIKELLSNAGICAPLKLISFRTDDKVVRDCGADALAEFSIQDGPSFRALIEIKPVANPKTIMMSCQQLMQNLSAIGDNNLIAILVAPYIANQQSNMLANAGISWIDLSGNMLIRVGGQIYIQRTGNPNKYPDTAFIKQIFQGTSSLVAKTLLLRPDGFSSLAEIAEFINSRGGAITISTVSKVLQSLENALLIRKDKSHFYATEPEQLLERLADGYRNILKKQLYRRFKCAVDEQRLFSVLSQNQEKYAACGFYAAKIKGLALTNEIIILVKSIEDVKRACGSAELDINIDEEYGQVVLIEIQDHSVWFNIEKHPYGNVIDDIQLYFEMLESRPRGPKIAEQLKRRILKKDSKNE